MKHPLERVPEARRIPALIVFLAWVVALFVILQVLDAPLKSEAAPEGIVSFELAETVPAAGRIVEAWDEPARLTAAFQLGLDYLFIPGYALALGMGTLIMAHRRPGSGFARLGAWLGWGGFVAGLLDMVENLALFQILTNGSREGLPQLAAACAELKFGLLGLGVIYVLTGLLIRPTQ